MSRFVVFWAGVHGAPETSYCDLSPARAILCRFLQLWPSCKPVSDVPQSPMTKVSCSEQLTFVIGLQGKEREVAALVEYISYSSVQKLVAADQQSLLCAQPR